MKIGYFADGPWAHLALEKISSHKDLEVIFIIPRFDRQDSVLKEWAKKLKVEFIPLRDVNSVSSLKKIKSFDTDLFISMSFNQILKKEILNIPEKGFINCHAGALPFYRGRNILNWALINDEKEFGVTVHYIDEGIDTGDIIIQKKSQISDEDTYESLLEKATVICADTLYEALDEIRLGKVNKIKQSSIHPVGSYFCRRKEGDEWISWTWKTRRIFNFIRAISHPGPLAQTAYKGSILKISRSSIITDAPIYIGNPGEVIGKGDGFLIIKTGDSSIKIYTNDTNLKKNEENLNNLKIGDRLTST